MITPYLKQKAVWHMAVGLDEYAKPKLKKKQIKVRWEGKLRMVRDAQGKEVVSQFQILCKEKVSMGDYLELEKANRKWPVISVYSVPGLDGEEIYREVAL